MLWDSSQVDNLNKIIASGARAFSKEEMQDLLRMASKHKPQGFDAWAADMRLRYEGKQEPLVRRALRKRYEKTGDRMPVLAINWTKMIAASDAGVYNVEPERYLEDAKSVRLEDEARAAELEWLIDTADLDAIMPELEQRTLAVGTMFGVVDWDTVADEPRISLHWPADTICVCENSGPHDLRKALIFGHVTTSPNGVADQVKWWRIFSRASIEDTTWIVHIVNERGEAFYVGGDPATEYAGILPVFVAHAGIPSGSVYLDADLDIADVVDGLNVSRSNDQYISDLQGHDQVYYAGDGLEMKDIAVGPDVWTKIGGGETLQTLSFNPAFQDLREARKLALRELAISRSNNPDAYATEPAPPQSGVARMVQNQQHDRKLQRLSHNFVRMEETQLWPILLDMHDNVSMRQPKFGEVYVCMVPKQASSYEDPEAKVRRLETGLDRKVISPAQFAAFAFPDIYPTVADAVKAGLSDQVGQPAAPMTAPQSRLGALAAEAKPADVATPAPAPVADAVPVVADTALNGAQVTSLVNILQSVALGTLPKAAASSIIASAFPSMDPKKIAQMVSPLEEGSAVPADAPKAPVA